MITERALRMAELCAASYDPQDVRFKTVEDLRYGVIDQTLVIRGTANARNVFRDLAAVPWRSLTGSLMPFGFASGARVVWEALTPTEKAEIRWASGHSFGAAVALDIARALNVPLHTFGCPRPDFYLSVPRSVPHYRYACDDDLVTMIPRVMFRHSSAAFVLKDSDNQLATVKDHPIEVYIERLRRLL